MTFDLKQYGMERSLYLDLEKSNKERKRIFWIFSCLFALLILLSIFVLAHCPGKTLDFGPFILHDNRHSVRIAQSVIGILLVFVPLFLELVFKIRTPVLIILLYEIYLFMAMGIGTILEGFSTINHYDDVAHFVAGGLGAILGISAWFNSIDKPRKKENGRLSLAPGYAFGLFAVGFFGIIWEIFEYTVDGYMPYIDAQRTRFPNGDPRLGRDALWDTMKDLTVNILGGAFGLLLFYLVNRTCEDNYDRQLLILQKKK